MENPIIEFKRSFQIWRYTVSHRQLLLRSTKSPHFSTRIDVFFKNVGAVHLPSLFENLSIVEMTNESALKLGALDNSSIVRGTRKLFAVHGEGFNGYVVAAMVAWHEDGLEYHEPSHFSKNNLGLENVPSPSAS